MGVDVMTDVMLMVAVAFGCLVWAYLVFLGAGIGDTAMSVCTACGEFYRYEGKLHCPTDDELPPDDITARIAGILAAHQITVNRCRCECGNSAEYAGGLDDLDCFAEHSAHVADVLVKRLTEV
jgi:hypothetical protein